MGTRSLRYGYTTGSCAAAAAKGAARMLRDQLLVEEVEVILPRGEDVPFRLHGQEFTATSASCYVVKDSGDDPDVTNGAQIHASIVVEEVPSGRRAHLVVEGGTGIGRVTKPGLAVAVGEWAINPVPRLMIRHVVNEVLAIDDRPQIRRVTISIPNGAELAKKTLNARLGIIGGLSILGTTGIVKPVSAKAWTDTIDTSIDVARASGAAAVVLSTGRSSELVAQGYLGTGDWGLGIGENLPEEAYVMMGDHAGYAVRAVARKGVGRLILAGQFAKMLKIACRHEQTHVSSSSLDLGMLAAWVRDDLNDPPLADWVVTANTAREVLETSGRRGELAAIVCARARQFAADLAPSAVVQVLLVGYDKDVIYFG